MSGWSKINCMSREGLDGLDLDYAAIRFLCDSLKCDFINMETTDDVDVMPSFKREEEAAKAGGSRFIVVSSQFFGDVYVLDVEDERAWRRVRG